MGLQIGMKVRDSFVITLEDGREIKITRIKYSGESGGTYIDIEAPKTIRISRIKRTNDIKVISPLNKVE